MRLDQKTKINRLVIYFFYDADGIVDRYVPYMLEDIVKNCSELFVVCNGKLTPEGRAVFQKLTPNILVRENKGFDVWAYKKALEQYGWDKISEFDEIIMMNSTIMGPIYPLSEMFKEMNQRDLDFWGITKYHKYPSDPFGTIPYGYIPEHVQSHFIAVRKSMSQSLDFHNYWKTIPAIESYADAVGKHEAVFSKYFRDKGFLWESYVDTSDLEAFTHYPLMMTPTLLLKKYRCPIFKKRSFFHDYYDILDNSVGNQGTQLLTFLKEETQYDVRMIWENILRTQNMYDIRTNLHLNYVLPHDYCKSAVKEKKTALVIHSYFEDLIEYSYQYALSMPEKSDIYITVNTEANAEKVKSVFGKGPWKSIHIIKVQNRGRDVSALLVGIAPYVRKYDLVCFVHDKKVSQLDYGIKGYDFSERCYKNLLASKEFVCNVEALFDKEPNLGLLCPPPPYHAEYYSTLGLEWGINFEPTKQLFEKLKLACPISGEKPPVAPLGTMFWFRPVALRKLFEIGWEYENFPKEPNHTDGTILHAIERIYPFVVQDAGFFPAWVLSAEYANMEIDNLTFMLRNLNLKAFQTYGGNDYCGIIQTMNYYIANRDSLNYPVPGLRIILKRKIRRMVPKPVWLLMKKIYRFCGGKKWTG